jgi:hypothetical protein
MSDQCRVKRGNESGVELNEHKVNERLDNKQGRSGAEQSGAQSEVKMYVAVY